ncbi:MAG: NAD-dependent epimerase/dehydratase family protein [Nitrospiraceae bacterium]|nr:NAD-dependent epimerase/dehydratase family protein [Nitrospiraceae bacterium]
MESILITGGAGFIGSNLAEALLSMGHRITVIDDLSTGKMENIEALQGSGRMSFFKGSILDAGLLRSVIEQNGVTLISHQAAIPSVAKSVANPARSMEANVVGTATVFDVAARLGCKRIVFASSSSVYGDTPELPKRESMPLNPKSPYAASKAAKEMLAKVFSGLYGMEIVGLRYFNVYGRRQDPASEYAAVVPKFVTRALANEPITIDGDGLQTRDFTYIDDVIQANVRALTGQDVQTGVFNIAFGDRISVMDLARMILKVTGSKSEIIHNPPRPGDVRDSLADIGDARRALGYAPEFDLAAGLEKTISYFSSGEKSRDKLN